MANTTMMVYDPETQNHYRIQLVDTGSTDSHGNPIYQIGIDATAGGGGGAVTIADGADQTQGAKADTAWDGLAASPTIMGVLKSLYALLVRGVKTAANSLSISFASDQTGTAGSPATTVLSVQGVANGTAQPVSRVKGSKTFAQTSVSTATLLLATNASRKTATLRNTSSTVTVYLGKDNTVTSGTGLPLLANEALTDDDSSDAWWAIAATGSVTVASVEVV